MRDFDGLSNSKTCVHRSIGLSENVREFPRLFSLALSNAISDTSNPKYVKFFTDTRLTKSFCQLQSPQISLFTSRVYGI